MVFGHYLDDPGRVQTHTRGPRLGAVTVVVTLVPALLLCAAGFALGA